MVSAPAHWAKPRVLYLYFCAGFSSFHDYFITQNKGWGPLSDLPLVYKHMSFTSSTLLFSAEGSCYRRRANGIIYRIVKEKTLQSESLLRILTSCCQPREGNPSWVESFMRSSQCLFLFASRGEVQCRLPILLSYPLVPRQWYVCIIVIVMLYDFCFFFKFDMTTELLNRSQTWRPDPFQLLAVTTRRLSVFELGFTFPFSLAHLTFKVRGIETTIARLESVCFLTEQHKKIIAFAELNGNWSFLRLTWEGPQELIVCYICQKWIISQKMCASLYQLKDQKNMSWVNIHKDHLLYQLAIRRNLGRPLWWFKLQFIQHCYKTFLWQSRKTNFWLSAHEDSNLRLFNENS